VGVCILLHGVNHATTLKAEKLRRRRSFKPPPLLTMNPSPHTAEWAEGREVKEGGEGVSAVGLEREDNRHCHLAAWTVGGLEYVQCSFFGSIPPTTLRVKVRVWVRVALHLGLGFGFGLD
jgi:hypothetical protein